MLEEDSMQLSLETEKRIDLLFPPDKQNQVQILLWELCEDQLTYLHHWDESAWDRITFSILKLSDGDFEKFKNALRLAATDYRDLLVASGFANDIKAHQSWLPVRKL